MSFNDSPVPALLGVWPQVVSFLDLRTVTKLWLSGSLAMRHWLAYEVTSVMPSVVYSSSRRRVPSWPMVMSEMRALRELNVTFNPRYRAVAPPLALLPQTMTSLTNLTVPRLDERLNLHGMSPDLRSLSVTHAMSTDTDWPSTLPPNLQSLSISLITPCITCWCVRLPASLSRLHILLVRKRDQAAPLPLDTRILPRSLTDLSIMELIDEEDVHATAGDEQWPNYSAVDARQPRTSPHGHPTSAPPFHTSLSDLHTAFAYIKNTIASSSLHFHDDLYHARLDALSSSSDPPAEFVHLTTHGFASLEPFPLYPSLQPRLSNLTSLDLGFAYVLYIRARRDHAHRRNSEAPLFDPMPDVRADPFRLRTLVSASVSPYESSSSSIDLDSHDTPSTVSVASSLSLSGTSLVPPLPSRRRSHSSSPYSSSIGSRSSLSPHSVSTSVPDGALLFRTSPSSKPATPTLASNTLPHTPLSASSSFGRRPRSSSSGALKSKFSPFGSHASSVHSSSSSHSASFGRCIPSSPRSEQFLEVPTNLEDGWAQVTRYGRVVALPSYAGFEPMILDEEENEPIAKGVLNAMLSAELDDPHSDPSLTLRDSPRLQQAEAVPNNPILPIAELTREEDVMMFEVRNLPQSLTELRGQMSRIKPNAYRELESSLRVLKVLPDSRVSLRSDDLRGLPRSLEVLSLYSLKASQVSLLPAGLKKLSSSLEFDNDFRLEELVDALPRGLWQWKAPETNEDEPLALPPMRTSPSFDSSESFGEDPTAIHWPSTRTGSFSMAYPQTSKRLTTSSHIVQSSSHSSFSSTSRFETRESLMIVDDNEFDSNLDRRRRRRSSTSFTSASSSPPKPTEARPYVKHVPTGGPRYFPHHLTELDCSVHDLDTLASLPPQARKLTLTFSPKLLGPHQLRQRVLAGVLPPRDGPSLMPRLDVKSSPLRRHFPDSLESLTLEFKESALLDALLLPAGFVPPSENRRLRADEISAAQGSLEKLTYLKVTCEEEMLEEHGHFLRHCLPSELLDLLVQFGPPRPPKSLLHKSTGSGSSLFSRTFSPTPLRKEKHASEPTPALWPFGKGLPPHLQALALVIASSTAFNNDYYVKVSNDEIKALPESLVYLSMPAPVESESTQIDATLSRFERMGLEYHFNSTPFSSPSLYSSDTPKEDTNSMYL